MAYIPALDGLRALAVGAVVAYHLGYSNVPGGFIGVEVFFVLSGWLVCTLLAGEHRRTGRIDLEAFWIRRARRLLPAVVLLVATTLVVGVVVRFSQLASLRGDALAALAYVLNWRLLLDHQGYFEAAATRPSPLRHLWSLSIEEQFYLLLPFALLAVAWLARRSASRAALLMLGVAVASTLWRLHLDPTVGDTDRVYYGTDTRAAGFLVGAALGLVWHPQRLRHVPGRRAGLPLDLVALGSLLVLGWYTTQVSELDPPAFRSSLTLAQVASAVLVAALVHPVQGLVARGLSVAPLCWVGQRSYGIYLWHWPIVVAWARAPGQQPEAPLVSLAMVGATSLVAAASYRWLEQPIRQHGLRAAFGNLRDRVRPRLAARPAVAAGATALSVLALAGASAVTRDLVALPDVEPVSDRAGPESMASRATTSSDPTTTAAPPTPAAPGAAATPTDPAAQPVPPPPPPPPPPLPPTTAIGDSVMVGAAPALQARFGPGLVVDAEISRQGIDAAGHVRRLADEGRLGQFVILHLGTNGPFPGSIVDEIVAIVGDRHLILVNTKVPRRWEGEVNATLAAAAERHRTAALVDWHRVASTEAGLLRSDGYHLTQAGVNRYATLLGDTVDKLTD